MDNDNNINVAPSMNKEDRSSLVLGILTILIIVGIFLALLTALANNGRIGGEITAQGGLRRGSQTQFVYTAPDCVQDGDEVQWFVNGEKIADDVYTQGEPLTLDYTPSVTGQIMLQAKVGGKYTENMLFNVGAPVLTLTSPEVTLTYGDKIPMFSAECNGFVDGECPDCNGYGGQIDCRSSVVDEYGNTIEDTAMLAPGKYTLRTNCNCAYMDYEFSQVDGTLTILPRRAKIADIAKQYDGKTCIDVNSLKLTGIADGDDVRLEINEACFADKNTGVHKQIMLTGARLVGRDSDKYILDSNAYGQITPRQITLAGLTVADKYYDGTTAAQIEKLGKLQGVVDGDSVAIGSVSANFASAGAGIGKTVRINNVTLVGLDKDNYVFAGANEATADITYR